MRHYLPIFAGNDEAQLEGWCKEGGTDWRWSQGFELSVRWKHKADRMSLERHTLCPSAVNRTQTEREETHGTQQFVGLSYLDRMRHHQRRLTGTGTLGCVCGEMRYYSGKNTCSEQITVRKWPNLGKMLYVRLNKSLRSWMMIFLIH